VWELIEQAMMKKGIKPTMYNFMELTGLSAFRAAKIRNKQRNIKLETLDIVAEKLDLDIQDLISTYR
jgi:DNA-binding Xre family transcriptional regulator